MPVSSQDQATNPPTMETDATQQIVQDTVTNPPAVETDATQQIVQDTATNPPAVETDASQHIVQDTATLNLLAKQRGFMVRDVAHDGNCLFTAVETQLPRCGIHCDGESLSCVSILYGVDAFILVIRCFGVSTVGISANHRSCNKLPQVTSSIMGERVML